ncbi:MAG: L-rhamnose mutarotase [Actinomycetota bacterium]|nr:L-rhamnose mutarotase [Actinomycetota bacterium]
MQRVLFHLRINPKKVEEYKAHHREVWPDMQTALSQAGWRNYSLFLTNDGLLTGYLECEDFATCLSEMASNEVNARWQAMMAPYFIEIDGAPDGAMVSVEEVFHLD